MNREDVIFASLMESWTADSHSDPDPERREAAVRFFRARAAEIDDAISYWETNGNGNREWPAPSFEWEELGLYGRTATDIHLTVWTSLCRVFVNDELVSDDLTK